MFHCAPDMRQDKQMLWSIKTQPVSGGLGEGKVSKSVYLPPCKRSCSCRNEARLGSCRMRSGSVRQTCKAPSVTSLRVCVLGMSISCGFVAHWGTMKSKKEREGGGKKRTSKDFIRLLDFNTNTLADVTRTRINTKFVCLALWAWHATCAHILRVSFDWVRNFNEHATWCCIDFIRPTICTFYFHNSKFAFKLILKGFFFFFFGKAGGLWKWKFDCGFSIRTANAKADWQRTPKNGIRAATPPWAHHKPKPKPKYLYQFSKMGNRNRLKRW